MTRVELARALRAARPRDASGAEADAIAVRVFARVASLERRRSVAPRRIARAAVVLLAAAALARSGREPSRPDPSEPSGRSERSERSGRSGTAASVAVAGVGEAPSASRAAPSPTLATVLDRALAGDEGAVATLREGGAGARAAVLARIAGASGAASAGVGTEPDGVAPDADAEFALFARLGGPVGDAEATALARLGDACVALRAPCARALAAGGGESSVRALDEWMARSPESASFAAAALADLAHRGAYGSARRALRRAAGAGCSAAAAAAVASGDDDALVAWLRRTPEDAAPADVVAAVVARRDATAAVLRLLARQRDPGALRLALVARLPGVEESLEAMLCDPDRALAALDALPTPVPAPAWPLLPLALGGPADPAARYAIRTLPVAAVAAVADEAVRRPGAAAAPWLAALAEMGDPAVTTLRDLGRRPALGPGVVAALAEGRGDACASALADLASEAGLARLAVDALGRRLQAGDAASGDALLSLARAGQEVAALAALARSGPDARAHLEAACCDARLRPRAGEWLRRLAASRAPRGAAPL